MLTIQRDYGGSIPQGCERRRPAVEKGTRAGWRVREAGVVRGRARAERDLGDTPSAEGRQRCLPCWEGYRSRYSSEREGQALGSVFFGIFLLSTDAGRTEATTGTSAPLRRERSIKGHFGFDPSRLKKSNKSTCCTHVRLRNSDAREKGEGRCSFA